MKEGTKANKKITCKKVNRYTKEMVKSELARLESEEKGGVSVYHQHIKRRAADLGM